MALGRSNIAKVNRLESFNFSKFYQQDLLLNLEDNATIDDEDGKALHFKIPVPIIEEDTIIGPAAFAEILENRFYIIEPDDIATTPTWKTIAPLNQPIAGHCSAGSIYDNFIINGITQIGVGANGQRFKNNTWTTVSSVALNLNSAYISELYVGISCGGFNISAKIATLNVSKISYECNSPNNYTNLLKGRGSHKISGTLSNYIVSGGAAEFRLTSSMYSDCEEFILDANTFRVSPSMSTKKRDHCSLGDSKDNFIVTGGYTSNAIINDVGEKWNGTVWSTINVTNVKRACASSYGMSVVGGINNSNTILGTTETFNGTTWVTDSLVLNVARSNFAISECQMSNEYVGYMATGGTSNGIYSSSPVILNSVEMLTNKQYYKCKLIQNVKSSKLDFERQPSFKLGPDFLMKTYEICQFGSYYNTIAAKETGITGKRYYDTCGFNGVNWSMLDANSVQQHTYCPHFGSANAAIMAGGYNNGATGIFSEMYDGYIWQLYKEPVISRSDTAGSGTLNNGIAMLGSAELENNDWMVDNAEVIDSLSWKAIAQGSVTHIYGVSSAGTGTLALRICGYGTSTKINSVEKWNNVSWSTIQSCINKRSDASVLFSTVNDVIITHDAVSSVSLITEAFDGVSWKTTINSLLFKHSSPSSGSTSIGSITAGYDSGSIGKMEVYKSGKDLYPFIRADLLLVNDPDNNINENTTEINANDIFSQDNIKRVWKATGDVLYSGFNINLAVCGVPSCCYYFGGDDLAQFSYFRFNNIDKDHDATLNIRTNTPSKIGVNINNILCIGGAKTIGTAIGSTGALYYIPSIYNEKFDGNIWFIDNVYIPNQEDITGVKASGCGRLNCGIATGFGRGSNFNNTNIYNNISWITHYSHLNIGRQDAALTGIFSNALIVGGSSNEMVESHLYNEIFDGIKWSISNSSITSSASSLNLLSGKVNSSIIVNPTTTTSNGSVIRSALTSTFNINTGWTILGSTPTINYNATCGDNTLASAMGSNNYIEYNTFQNTLDKFNVSKKIMNKKESIYFDGDNMLDDTLRVNIKSRSFINNKNILDIVKHVECKTEKIWTFEHNHPSGTEKCAGFGTLYNFYRVGGKNAISHLSDVSVLYGGIAWKTLRSMSVARSEAASLYQSDIGMVIGGYNGSYLSNNAYINLNTPDPTWTSYSISLPVSASRLASAGGPKGCILAGGYNGSSLSNTFRINGGTSISTDDNYPITAHGLAGCGRFDNALFTGGESTNLCHKFNGFTWSTSSSLLTTLKSHSIFGYPNSCMVTGGHSDGSAVNKITDASYEFNGIAWKNMNCAMNVRRASNAYDKGSSIKNAIVTCGDGYNGSILFSTEYLESYKIGVEGVSDIAIPQFTNDNIEIQLDPAITIKPFWIMVESSIITRYRSCSFGNRNSIRNVCGSLSTALNEDTFRFDIEGFNGLSWSIVDSNLPVCYWWGSAVGISGDGLVTGTNDGTDNVSRLNNLTWSNETARPRDSKKIAGVGVVNDCIFGGGLVNNTAINNFDRFDGSTWSMITTGCNTARSGHTMAGSANSAIIIGGDRADNIEEWNGTTWVTKMETHFTYPIAAGSNINNVIITTTYINFPNEYYNTTDTMIYNGETLIAAGASNLVRGNGTVNGSASYARNMGGFTRTSQTNIIYHTEINEIFISSPYYFKDKYTSDDIVPSRLLINLLTEDE